MKASSIFGSFLMCLAVLIVSIGESVGADTRKYASGDIVSYDQREIALLPSYCIYTQIFRDRVPGGNNTAEIERWHAKMGPTFNAMHHYCWGLMKTNRALLFVRGDRQLKTFLLKSSIDEFDYVLRASKPDFVLLPEILTKKGENLVLLGENAAAILQLERAIEIKPDYWPPYAALGDYYKSIGNIAAAREVLEKALIHAPDAGAVKRRLNEMDTGKAKKGSAPK